MHTYDESTDDLAEEIVNYALARIPPAGDNNTRGKRLVLSYARPPPLKGIGV